MTVTVQSLATVSLDAVVLVVNAAFADYAVKMEHTAATLARELVVGGVNLHASQIAVAEETIVGVVLVGCRGWTWRIATMGVAPAQQNRGVGRRLLEAVIESAPGAGIRQIDLEVIEGNLRARGLYESLGFRTRRRLVGYAGAAPEFSQEGLHADTVTVMDPQDVARILARESDAAMPWQLSPESLATASFPTTGISLNNAAWGIAAPRGEHLALLGLVVSAGQRRQGLGRRLVAAAAKHFNVYKIAIPALVPENVAPAFFAALNLHPTKLAQQEMRLILPTKR